MNRSSKPSMKDVAKHANVSVTTVSHVLNNTRFVADETKRKVMESVEALGYVPDSMARSFKTGKKYLIGIIVPDISNPVWAIIIEEVESVLAKAGYRLIIVNTKETEKREKENLKVLSSGMVDGLIVATTLTDYSEIASLIPDNFPMVFIDRQLPDCPYDTIIPQDYSAIYEGIHHMISQGHTQIGIITGLMRLSTSVNRLNAYKQALSDFGIPLDENLIKIGNSMSQGAVPLVKQLLEYKCTAIVVSNNVMLDDVMYYFNSQGIRAGKDIMILGQAVESHRGYATHRASVILQPSKTIGQTAAERILKRIEDPNLPVQNTVLNSMLLLNE